MPCKACGCVSIVPMDVTVESEADEEQPDVERESRFFSCYVCGDNWLSVKEFDEEGGALLTLIHQMGMAPVLKRITALHDPDNDAEDTWVYYHGDDEVSEHQWCDRLEERRQILRSICTN